MDIEKAGRTETGSLFVEAIDHRFTQTRKGAINRVYHGVRVSAPSRDCCKEFEKQAQFELSGLQLVGQLMDDLEE